MKNSNKKDVLIEKLQKQLRESNESLRSILYCPEQVNWSYGGHKPSWLVNRIAQNNNLLDKEF